jgi:transcriptional regulator of acetoin/glycerol metabolism
VASRKSRWRHDETLTEAHLRDAYTVQGLTCPESGREGGLDGTTVYRYLLRYGIRLRSSGTRPTRRDGYLRPADVLTKRYLERAVGRRNMSTDQIARETGVGRRTMRRYMELSGVAPRPEWLRR